MIRLLRYPLCVSLLFVLIAAAPAQTPKTPGKDPAVKAKKDPAAAFFADETMLYLAVEIAEPELKQLRQDPRKYVSVTLLEGDKDTKFGKTPKDNVGVKATYTDVAMHLKGAAGSFRQIDDKPGLTLNMDKLVDSQRFHGLDKFHLANSVQDPAYLSELICGYIFRAGGVPASRIRPAVVTVQGRMRGMYYLKEGYDKLFLRRHMEDRHGNLYDGGFLRDIDQPLQALSGTGDVANYGDLKALMAACQEPDAKKRFAKMEKVLDMDEFISYLAIEVLVWDWDGYPMNRNNYRIYHEPKKDKIIFIPSGMDQMYGNPGGPLLPGFNGVVARTLIETPEGKDRYVKRMREILKTIYKPDDLVKKLDHWESQVKPALTAIDPNAGRDYTNQVNRLRHAIVGRGKSLEDQLSKLK
jgi:spore coat protein H